MKREINSWLLLRNLAFDFIKYFLAFYNNEYKFRAFTFAFLAKIDILKFIQNETNFKIITNHSFTDS